MLCLIGSHELGPHGVDDNVLVYGVPGRQHSARSLQVHVQTLMTVLGQLSAAIERLVLVEGSSVDAPTARTIDEMLAAMGPEDGLVRFQIPADAIKLIKRESGGAPGASPNKEAPRFVERGIDRASLLAFRPPEVLRVSSLVAALRTPPVGEWVDPAGLMAAHGALIETYPPGGRQTRALRSGSSST